MVVFIVFLTIIFCLCILFIIVPTVNRLVTQPNIAEQVLEEKYGEKFIAKDVKGKFSGFSAICCPERDQTIHFEAVVIDDGAYLRDEYVQGVISKELKTQINPIVQKITSDFWVEPIVYYAETNYDSINDVTIENYLEQVEHPKCNINIYVNKDLLKDLTLEEEYQLFEEKIPNIDHFFGTVYVFYTEHFVIFKKKLNFIKKKRGENADFKSYEVIPDIRLVYEGQKLVTSFEDFCKRREAVEN